MSLVLDDVFMTSHDERAANMFKTLEGFAAQWQVLVFIVHHQCTGIAARPVQPQLLGMVQMQASRRAARALDCVADLTCLNTGNWGIRASRTGPRFWAYVMSRFNSL